MHEMPKTSGIHRPRSLALLIGGIVGAFLMSGPISTPVVALFSVMILPAARAANPPIHVPNSPLTVTDVSPDSELPRTQSQAGSDTGGRIRSLVIDPNHDNVLYAGSEWAGVWKSADSGTTWKQASIGLRSGMTFSNTSLAVDPANSQRLLYATQDDDGTTTQTFGGLWVSVDGAGHWKHPSSVQCNSGPPTIYSVVFAFTSLAAAGSGSEVPYVATACGIWSTFDPLLMAGWYLISQQLPGNANAVLASAHGGSTVFACSSTDGKVYRSLDPAGGKPWQVGPPVIGLCNRIAIAPLNQFTPSVLVVLTVSPIDRQTSQTVQIVDFDHNIPFQNLGWPDLTHNDGSGIFGVFAPLRHSAGQFDTAPGVKYDVYAGSGLRFYRFNKASLLWDQLSSIHDDTWAMAFPSSYDPAKGDCAGYASSDGGVYANLGGPLQLPDCVSFGGVNSWYRSSAGLHAMWGQYMTGLSQPSSSCPPLTNPCPVLYFPSVDNDIWVFRRPAFYWPFNDWALLGDSLGDAGQ